MTMPDTFQTGTDWQQSSGPYVNRQVAVADLWPQGTRSGSGTKDTIAAGEHPVLAIGGMTAADGRPENLTGVVVDYLNDYLVQINVADGMIVKAYVANVLTYSGGAADTFETAPVIGQPVYVDDSDDLSEGVTLSLSPLNDAGLANPLAGWLFYCQDEYLDSGVGGPNVSAQWPPTWADELTETEVCVILTNDSGQACCDV